MVFKFLYKLAASNWMPCSKCRPADVVLFLITTKPSTKRQTPEGDKASGAQQQTAQPKHLEAANAKACTVTKLKSLQKEHK